MPRAKHNALPGAMAKKLKLDAGIASSLLSTHSHPHVSAMDHSQQITAALKQFLKEKGVTYAMLAQKIGLSEASVKRLFSTSAFTLKRLAQICEARELSHVSMSIIKRKLEHIAVGFNELAEIDNSLAISKRASVGMVLAIRPWVFSIVSALKRKRFLSRLEPLVAQGHLVIPVGWGEGRTPTSTATPQPASPNLGSAAIHEP